MLRIATRRSALARAQAHQTGLEIKAHTGRDFELVPMATTGDLSPQRAVGDFDTKGLFVDTIRAAVRSGDCHLAVHSYKDLPSEAVDELIIGGVPQRADPRDVLVSREGYALTTLPALATVATSSERRRLQLLRTKPGLQVLPVRGNIDSRLRKVADGEFDAAVLAFAGIQRLYTPTEAGGAGPFTLPLKAAPLEPGEVLSAPAQGALALECRADDEETRALVRAVDHQPTHRAVRAERAFLESLGGGCLTPIGALATVTPGGGLELIGMLGDPVRRRMIRRSLQGAYEQPERLGRDLAADILTAGGQDMVTAIAQRRGESRS